MNDTLKKIIFSLFLSLLLTTQIVHAQFVLVEDGEVTQINNTSINVNDAQFNLSPTVKIYTTKKEKRLLTDIKTGAFVRISVFNFNKRKLVDSIEILDGPAVEPSEP